MTMYIAKLALIAELSKMPEEFKPFVLFRAKLERRRLEQNEKIAILNIEGTSSYFPIFLGSDRLKDIEEKFNKQNTILNAETRRILEQRLGD